jgi:hypothetical protein
MHGISDIIFGINCILLSVFLCINYKNMHGISDIIFRGETCNVSYPSTASVQQMVKLDRIT